MSSVKGRLVRLLGGVMLKRGTVHAVQDLGGFQWLGVRCDAGPIAAGTKLQILLPSDDMRTYTPIAAADGFSLLGWKHAGGPGARWLASVQVGDAVVFVGPQRSLELAAGPVVLVGDETSVAVAAALAAERPGHVQAVIQTAAPADVRRAAQAVALPAVATVAPADIAATVDLIRRKLADWPTAQVALTGCSEPIVAIRQALRGSGAAHIKTKTYWIPGKTGLD